MELGDNVTMFATCVPEMGHASRKDLSGRSFSMLCYVDDVDSHFANAKKEGAKIISEPEDKFYGDRTYTAEDFEGHQWSFTTHVRDVSPADM